VVVLFPSKTKQKPSISKNKTIIYFCSLFRRSVFENTYDSITKGTNNTGNSNSGVNEMNFS
jgi:hypothetical protein